MKILVVCCSPRKTSCSSALANEFICGAKKAEHEIFRYTLAGKNIHGCNACKYCYSHEGICVQQDDIAPIIEKMRECQMLVLATPTYYYSLPAQAKMVFDRMYARHGRPLSIRKSALLLTLEDSADQTDLITTQYKTVAEYMGWENIGVACADGLWGNTIPDDHPALKQARELGAAI